MVLPSAIITTEAQLHILNSINCKLYLRPASAAAAITDEIVKRQPSIQAIEAPDLDELLRDDPAEPVVYEKSWTEARDDPWLVFHSSGTTGRSWLKSKGFPQINDILGRPKPITYTHQMMVMQDKFAGLRDLAESNIHQWAFKRWYTPLPALHVCHPSAHLVGKLTRYPPERRNAHARVLDRLRMHRGRPRSVTNTTYLRNRPRHN